MPLTRRELLGAATAAGVVAAACETPKVSEVSASPSAGPGIGAGASPAAKGGGPGTAGVQLTWFGTNGWEIAFGEKTILIDPWFGRFDAGFFPGPGRTFDLDHALTTDQATLDQHVKKANLVLIGHGHWDHVADIPQIAKKTDAQVVGSESHLNALRAAGIPNANLIQVKGGEFVKFDGFSLQVFPGLHSMGPRRNYNPPGHLASVPAKPASTIRELPEGDSLIYLITIADRFRIFSMSTANFVEAAINGLRPDVALIASIFASSIVDFTPRLLNALGRPKIVLPTHWDNFERPFSEPPRDLRQEFGNDGSLDLWVEDVRKASPETKVTVLKFFDSFAP